MLTAALWLLVFHVNATTRFVTTTGTGSGTSWVDASSDLQGMINTSSPGDEVWVATGTYKPTAYPTGCSGCNSTRDYTFFVKDGVSIYGGFAGTETDISQRNITANPTTLSGDFNDDDVVTGSGSSLSITGNGENAYHVVVSSAPSSGGIGVTIDGFIITGGNADIVYLITINGNNLSRREGGGIYINNGENLLMNNNVLNNSASFGGGIYCNNSTNTLESNSVLNNFGGDGGGINLDLGINTLINNTISGNVSNDGGGIKTYFGSFFMSENILSDNYSYNQGGGILNLYSTCLVLKNILSGNWAYNSGGGIYLGGGDNKLSNNILHNNSARYGGAICFLHSSLNTITNNTISGNSAENGGGIYNASGKGVIRNNIFYGNQKEGSSTIAGADYYVYSVNDNTFKNNALQLIDTNYPLDQSTNYGIGTLATGNIFAQDPLFLNYLDPIGPDNIWYTTDDGLRLQNNSPAVNAGTLSGAPITDITDAFRVGNPDIGAYEYIPDSLIIFSLDTINNLLTAYPNSFTQSTTIAFTLLETTEAVLNIYGIDGREVAQIFKGIVEAGKLYSVEFNGAGLSSGIYIVSLTGATGVQQRYRLVLTD